MCRHLVRTFPSVALSLATIVLPSFGRPAIAQTSTAERDSVQRDTIQRDTVRRPIHPSPLIYPIMAALMTIVVAAPPAMLLVSTVEPVMADRSAPLFADRHVYAYGAAGPGSDTQDRTFWAATEVVEVFVNGIYGEARVEQFGLHERNIGLRTVRLGYLARPRRQALGGVTIGCRAPRDHRDLHGVEVGLPLIMGNRVADVRFEPRYLISTQGVSWNYLFQADLAAGDSPLVFGVRITAHTFEPHGSPSNAALALLVGVRGWRLR